MIELTKDEKKVGTISVGERLKSGYKMILGRKDGHPQMYLLREEEAASVLDGEIIQTEEGRSSSQIWLREENE